MAMWQEHICMESLMFCDSFIEMLCKRRGISQDSTHISYDMYKQAEYDKLADVIRANMDMDYIYRVIGL